MQIPEGLLTTAEVCRVLGVTPAKLRRLTREGYLEITEVKSLKYGDENFYNSTQVGRLRQQMPRILSKWATEENIRVGAQKAGMNRALESVSAFGVRQQGDRFLSSLEYLPEKTSDLLMASYYLFHLNHYAKSGHPYLYDLKEKILKHLVKQYIDTPYLQVTLVQGQHKVDLCQDCRSKANRLNVSYGEYANSYGGCPRCKKRSSYYDLFEFNIQYDDHRFSFHTPYSVGKKWFRHHGPLPRQYRGHRQEMGLTFGRPITEREARALPMDMVIEKLDKLLEKYSFSEGKDRDFVE